MRIKFIYLLILSVSGTLIFGGCRQHSDESQTGEIVFEKVDSVSWEILPAKEMIPFAQDIALQDSTILLLGLFEEEWLHRYDMSDGSHLESVINRGVGPGEIVNAISLGVVADGTISIHDLNVNKLWNYNPHTGENICIRNLGADREVTWNAWQLTPEKYLSKNPVFSNDNSPVRSYSLTDLISGESICGYSGIPEDFKEDTMSLMAQSCMTISPDLKHFANATTLGGILEFYSIDGDSIVPVYSRMVYPLKYEVVGDEKRIESEPIIGYTAICSTDEEVIASFSGTKMDQDARKIGVWSWDGSPLRQINTDRIILRIAVDKKGKRLYGVVYDEDEGPMLARLGL